MPISEREVATTYKDQKIRFVNSWFAGCKLYIDGECRDTSSAMIATNKTTPLMTAKLNDEEILEIYLTAIWAIKIKKYVNGQNIAGDVF